jgi:two-component system, OmpR family, phosphate regulon sensor histidine kinase PhoR
MRLRTRLVLVLGLEAAVALGAFVAFLALAGWPPRAPHLVWTLAGAVGIGAAGSLFLGARLGAVIRRPFLEIAAVARSAAADEPRTTLDGTLAVEQVRARPDDAFIESAEAIKAFNEMLEQVARHLAALRTEKSTLESVLTHMSDALLILDSEGVLSLVNPPAERMFGLSARQAQGRRLIEVLHHFELDALVGQAERERVALTREIEVHYPEDRWLRVQANPVSGRRGEFLGTVVVAQDVTDLRRTDLIRQEFVANVSHELRTPLASLRALAETLQDGALQDREAGPRFLSRIIAEIDRLTLLVSDLLDLSAIEGGSAKMEMAPVSVRDMVGDVIAKFRPVADRRQIALRADGIDGLPRVWGDEVRLEQALSNLVDNAVKYTPDGGAVTVSGQVREDLVALSVTDTGIGIPSEHLPRIFERFYRVDRSRSRALGGTGLGLSIVKHIATSHGGRVEVQSTEGRGSSFTLVLPRAPDGASRGP